MRWHGWVIAVLVSGVARAQPIKDDVEPVSVSTASQPRSLWIQPVTPAAVLIFSAKNSYLGRYAFTLPMGLSIPLSPVNELVLEFTPLFIVGGGSAYGLYAAAGLSRMVVPDGSGGGFFVHLKGIGAVGYNSFTEFDEDAQYISTEQAQLSLGLDVGYRFKSKRLFVDLLLGGALGVGFNMSTPNLGLGLVKLLTLPGGTRLTVDPNFHLLRVGTTF